MRILTALVGIPVVVALTWVGGWPFAAMLAAISVAAQWELYGMGTSTRALPGRWLALGAGACAALFPLGMPWVGAAVLLTVATFLSMSLRGTAQDSLQGTSMLALGIIYPPVLLGTLGAVRLGVSDPSLDAFALTLEIIVLVWTADTAAYYAGRSFGRHALSPALSPKKTWEGFAGGVIGAALLAGAFSVWFLPGLPAVHHAALALFAAVAGPMGDLFESSLKRSAGVKDSASVLPGHGGFLDRFDALAAVAPLSWLYLHFVAGIVG